MPSVECSTAHCQACHQSLVRMRDTDETMFHACLNRACPEYEFADLREVLGRPRNTPARQQPRTRKRRALKPGEARIRYNDGSHYSLSRVMDVTHGPQGVRVTQALPMRSTVTGYVEHLIPAHNVDVISVRRHGLPEDLIDHHEHCAWCGEHHASAGCAAAPWYVRAWDWLVR